MAGSLLWTVDLDDTLIDTERSILPRVRESIRRARLVLGSTADNRDEAIVQAISAIGPSSTSRLPRILAALGVDASHPAAAAAETGYYVDLNRVIPLIPGALDAIAALRASGPVIIVTNGPADLQARKVAATGLGDYVDGVVISGVEGVEKPDPEIFRLACARTGIAPDRATHIGDSLATDVAGARAAEFRAVWFRRPWARNVLPDPTPDAIIDTLEELALLRERPPAR